jgi:hypothetical protein
MITAIRPLPSKNLDACSRNSSATDHSIQLKAACSTDKRGYPLICPRDSMPDVRGWRV